MRFDDRLNRLREIESRDLVWVAGMNWPPRFGDLRCPRRDLRL